MAGNPYNYDTWFDYIRLEEDHADRDRTRDVYERAIANPPPVAEKRSWKRFVFARTHGVRGVHVACEQCDGSSELSTV